MSPFQEIWTYAHIKRSRKAEDDRIWNLAQMICTFINPEAAKKVFGEKEISESENFYDDLKAMDPSIDLDQYREVIENVGK